MRAVQEGKFEVVSDFQPTGDQPGAIDRLVEGMVSGRKLQVLLGVTGSGKTYTMAKVAEAVQRPTLVIAHNKTLAAQLANRVQGVLPHQCRGVLCQLLRLLST